VSVEGNGCRLATRTMSIDTDTDCVRLTREPDTGIARLTLTDPDRRNTLSAELADGVIAALDGLAGTDTRCVVVDGEGSTFSAGGDVEAMVDRAATDEPLDDTVRQVIENTGRCVQRLYECPFPTVATVTGTAFGAGANLAIACDVLLFHEAAEIGFGFRNGRLVGGLRHLTPPPATGRCQRRRRTGVHGRDGRRRTRPRVGDREPRVRRRDVHRGE
jgi:Enoyl-CoA hydratase/carnithine racemase